MSFGSTLIVSTSEPSHIAQLKSGGTFETLPVILSSTRPSNQAPAYQPPSDDEKKRRVQCIQSNLLPSPQPQSSQPSHERVSPTPIRSHLYDAPPLQRHEYSSTDIYEEVIARIGPPSGTTATIIQQPPPNDPPGLMEDISSSSDNDDHPPTYDTYPPQDPFMHSRTDSSVNPSTVSEPDHHTTLISIPIAYLADKVDQFASNLKQDAQIRSTMSFDIVSCFS